MEWTDEVILRLRALWDEGLSTAEIGRRLGVSKNAVVGKAHRMALPPRPSPIRRDTVGVARPVAPRRVVGPTLPPLPAMVLPAVALPAAAPAVLRPVEPPGARPPRAAVLVRAVPVRALASGAGQAAGHGTGSGRSTACCWPLGEPGTKSFRFCDDPALAGKPYCGQHAQLAYVKVRDRRDEEAA